MLILLDIETCFQLCLTKDEGVSVSAHTRRLDHVRLDDGAEGELHGGGVDDSDDVAASGALEDREEGPLHAVLGVQVDDLLDVVGSLEELDAGVEGTSVGAEHHLNGGDGGVEGLGVDGPSLDGARDDAVDAGGDGGDVGAGAADVGGVGLDGGGEGVLHGGGVAYGDGVLAAGGVDDAGEGAEVSVLDVDPHLLGGVVGSLPELDVGVEGTSVGLHHDEDLVDGRGGEGPGAEGPSLGGDGGGPLPDGVHLGGAHGTAPHGGVHALGGIGDAGRGGDGSPGGGEGGAEAGLGGLGGEGGGAGDADSEREELGRELHCRGKRRGENEGRGLLRTQTVGTGVDRGLLRPTRDTHKQGQS
mmetsp:Transcript_35476/g.72606  ORF Transcript_35476/g.72606 Transcript_35476/m.72606 type:complete len:358 (+) Transcript_35476:186-1259(+)